MTLAVIGFAVFALVRTVVAPEEEELNGIVVLLDRSASMSAADANGTTRLELAKKDIRARLDAIPESVGVAEYQLLDTSLVPGQANVHSHMQG